MKEKLIQSTAGALNCWRKCEECRVISNTGNNDQTGVASYGQKTPSWPAQYTVCNVQCMHNGPKLGTWSSWGPNCWNGPHLVLILHKRPHLPQMWYIMGFESVFLYHKWRNIEISNSILLYMHLLGNGMYNKSYHNEHIWAFVTKCVML